MCSSDLVQPQPQSGDPIERFNWDAPILVSPHSPRRLYYASQRVWRSDDRGDSWKPVSGDLTRNQDRMLLPLMGRKWSWDSPWDMIAMSTYDTITSLAESPKAEGLLYAGTDDGLIQVSEDGGATWRKIEVGSITGVPAVAFVNDIKADLFDANTVYAALDDHKSGSFRPYLLKSSDRGRTWRSITGDLPDRHLVWRVVQDHVKPDLLFAGTEFGIFFTIDGGGRWMKLGGDVPTISFRDLAIQRRENDLVGASFGRGFYVLDDYSALRDIAPQTLAESARLFPLRDAYLFSLLGQAPAGSAGVGPMAGNWTAPNPPFGAVFTYQVRQDLPADTKLVLTITDDSGKQVRRLELEKTAGLRRVAWNLRTDPPAPGEAGSAGSPQAGAAQGGRAGGPGAAGGFGGFGRGGQQAPLVPAGRYRATLGTLVGDKVTAIGPTQTFAVVQIPQ